MMILYKKKILIMWVCMILFFMGICGLSGCANEEESAEVTKLVEEVQEIEEEEEEQEISMDPNRYEFIRAEVQNQLSVFDTNIYEKPLMDSIYSQISGKVSKDRAEQIIDSALETLLPEWHRQIVISTLNFEVGEGLYSQDDIERIVNDTSINPLAPLVRGYAITKLKTEGKLK